MGWLSAFLVNPGLAAGAALVASPILIHLLSRRRFRQIRWAAMDFLLEAQRKNRRRVRMEQWILLALRCLAVLLIALMIARPFVRTGAMGTFVGSAPRTERIFLLDDSFSMRYRLESGRTVFAGATSMVSALARRTAEESPSDSATLLLTSRPRAPRLALNGLDEERLRQLDDTLGALTASEEAARVSDAFSAIAEMLRGAPAQVNATVYAISDFQKRDWAGSLSEGRKPAASVVARLAELAANRPGLSLVLVDVGAESPHNLAVVDLTAEQPRIAAGVPARYHVDVANYSPQSVEGVELSLHAGDQSLPPLVIPRIAPGQVVREPIEVSFTEEGSAHLRIGFAGRAAQDDPLPLDNVRFAAAQVVGAVQILLVNGEPNSDVYRDEAYLLRTALRPGGRVASGNEVTTVEEHELEGVEWEKYQLVMLVNVRRLSQAAEKGLEEFVKSGGGLVVFAGDQVDGAYYNETLHRGGAGVLPAAIGERVEAPAAGDGFAIGTWDASHPLLRAFTGELASVLRQVRVREFLTLSPARPASTSPAPTSQPKNQQLNPVEILARFNDSLQSAAMLTRRYGQGAVFMIATSADSEWNDWPANFSYVPIMLELAQHAARPTDGASSVLAGAVLRCPIDLGAFKPELSLRPPAYPAEPAIKLAATTIAGAASASYSPADRCGVWQFDLNRTAGGQSTRCVAVNTDPSESDLARTTRAQLDIAISDMEFEYVRGTGDASIAGSASRTELWWPVLIAAITALMAEHTLAWWFGKRG